MKSEEGKNIPILPFLLLTRLAAGFGSRATLPDKFWIHPNDWFPRSW